MECKARVTQKVNARKEITRNPKMITQEVNTQNVTRNSQLQRKIPETMTIVALNKQGL